MDKPTIPPPPPDEFNGVATPDDFVMPLPPNMAPVEQAIAKIEGTLRKRKKPGWSDDDFANLGTAVRLCADREECIPRGLQKRFARSCEKLAIPIMWNPNDTVWIEFGENVRAIAPVVEATCGVLLAIKRIAASLPTDGTRNPSEEDARIILEAQDCVRKFWRLMPKRVLKGFHVTLALAGIRESLTSPATTLDERIRDVEGAIPVMAALADSKATAESPARLELKIQQLRKVFGQFGIIWHRRYTLPDSVVTRFENAAHAFATAVVERRSPHWKELQGALGIEVDPGYLCGGMRVPPLEELPWP